MDENNLTKGLKDDTDLSYTPLLEVALNALPKKSCKTLDDVSLIDVLFILILKIYLLNLTG